MLRLRFVSKATAVSSGAKRARKKFLRYFPGGFRDATYLEWEREYKWETHERWEEALGRENSGGSCERANTRRSRRARCGQSSGRGIA